MNSSMGTGWSVLSQKRIQVILDVLSAQQIYDRQLLFVPRTPVTPASDNELVGEFFGEFVAADLIADDQQATTYDTGHFEFKRNNLPNIKIGLMMGQKQLNELNQLKSVPGAVGTFADEWVARRVGDLVRGVRMRIEQLIVACYRDQETYDRGGIKITGSWGMPSDLKLTVQAPWDQPSSATPVADLTYLTEQVAPDFATNFNRVTLSKKAFRYMVATDEFKSRAKIIPTPDFSWYAASSATFPDAYDPRMMRLAEAVTGLQFEFYEARINTKNNDGTTTRNRILPVNEILLSDSNNDGNRACIDLGNAICTESMIAELVGQMIIGGLPTNAFGPIGYAAPTSIDLNAPGVTMWQVQRAFPRKFDRYCTAWINTGTAAV